MSPLQTLILCSYLCGSSPCIAFSSNYQLLHVHPPCDNLSLNKDIWKATSYFHHRSSPLRHGPRCYTVKTDRPSGEPRKVHTLARDGFQLISPPLRHTALESFLQLGFDNESLMHAEGEHRNEWTSSSFYEKQIARYVVKWLYTRVSLTSAFHRRPSSHQTQQDAQLAILVSSSVSASQRR